MVDTIEASPLHPSQLCSHHLVFETIYKPQTTKLLEYAIQTGAKVVYGWEMFVEQGAAQFEIHTNSTAPRDAMIQALGVSA
jgi:shikimate dehydrogenase